MSGAYTPGPFVESACLVGGCLCPAWDEWFQACEDTDPSAVSEERDPAPLSEWPFNPLSCERPDLCRLYAEAHAAAPKAPQQGSIPHNSTGGENG